MAGAVCGDHCSPISDTTIMASAGAQCEHVNHVSSQLPYAITCAAVSFVAYLAAGLTLSLSSAHCPYPSLDYMALICLRLSPEQLVP